MSQPETGADGGPDAPSQKEGSPAAPQKVHATAPKNVKRTMTAAAQLLATSLDSLAQWTDRHEKIELLLCVPDRALKEGQIRAQDPDVVEALFADMMFNPPTEMLRPILLLLPRMLLPMVYSGKQSHWLVCLLHF
jgi:hypothetical protein